jgi:hypothetical protein
MAPSLEVEEPVQVDFEAPLKAAPKLVAPEPGTSSPPPLIEYDIMSCSDADHISSQNTVPAPNRSQPAKQTLVLDVPISRYAPPRPKVPIPTSLS